MNLTILVEGIVGNITMDLLFFTVHFVYLALPMTNRGSKVINCTL